MTRTFYATLAFVLSFCLSAAANEITPADKDTVLNAVITHLETDYADETVGLRSAEALKMQAATGAFEEQSSGEEYANALSEALQALTGDGHLNIEYSDEELSESDNAIETYSAAEMERWYGAHLNYGVERVERLEGHIGLIDLRVFAPIDMGADTVTAAMNVVAHMDGLIIDLRNNGGGIGDMANLVASYLFDAEPRPLTGIYDRPSDTLTQQYTQSYVPGDRFGKDKPVYVLISPKTFSAAEALAYDLQALGRATIVGEASGGGAHPFEYIRIHPHFILWSVTAKSVNPITGGNWQGVGVQPEVVVPADDALDEALKRIRKDLSSG
ncbi:MAG: S41 family peptidase [Pseudomonadota bacterium]